MRIYSLENPRSVLKDRLIIFLLIVLVSGLSSVLLALKLEWRQEAFAGTGQNVKGFAWSPNIGWISFNSKDCDINGNGIFEGGGETPAPAPAGCPTSGTVVDYGVNIDTSTGAFSGYAWSSNFGWIDFAPAGPYPMTPNNSASYDKATGQVSGWAKILSLGADGWINLAGSTQAQYQCPSGGSVYADQATCDAACTQTANCNPSTPSISISGDFKNPYGSRLSDAHGNGSNKLYFDSGIYNGYLILSGATVSGTYTFGQYIPDEVYGDGSNKLYFNHGYLTLSGATVSGAFNATVSGAFNEAYGDGSNKLYFKSSDGSSGYVTLSGVTIYNCPLSGGSVCAGTPQTCTASQTCNQITAAQPYGVSIDGTSGDFFGWAWNANDTGAGAGWISFNSKDCDVDNNGFTDTACGGDNATTALPSYKVVFTAGNNPPAAQGLTAPNWSFAQAASLGALRAFPRWQFNDPDCDPVNNPGACVQAAYELIVSKNSDFSSAVVSTGKVAGSANQYLLDQSVLNYGTPYYWKVRVWDDQGAVSPWASYATTPDTDNDDANVPTFTTYKHEMPNPDFTWLPANPSKGQSIRFTDNSKIYLAAAPSTAVPCGTGSCAWLWTAPNATIVAPTASSTLIKFTTDGPQTVTLKVTDNDGYYASVTKSINIRAKLPIWKETR